MKKFGIDIMTAKMREDDVIGRILLPMPGNRSGWHDIMYVDEDSIPEQAERNARKSGRGSSDPNVTTARLAWDERGSQKKGTSHVRLDVTLPCDQDSWEADVLLGMNPAGQPVCRVALPDNGLCEIYCHGRLITIAGEGREAACMGSVDAEFRGRMIHASIDGCALRLLVEDERRPKPKNRRRGNAAKKGAGDRRNAR